MNFFRYLLFVFLLSLERPRDCLLLPGHDARGLMVEVVCVLIDLRTSTVRGERKEE
jgi:hypothetical protein